MIAADGEHRHLQPPAPREPDPIVRSVLIEGGELGESGVHGTRASVKRRVVNARRFIEARRIGGEVVPEAIEIDPLTAGHQPFHAWTAEAEMPQQGGDARNRRVHHHELRHALGVLRGNKERP